MTINILTIFPEMFESVFSASILGRAREQGLLDIRLTDIRPYSASKHKNTDDYPFGGGAGMVMMAQPIMDAMAEATSAAPGARRIYLGPRGRKLTTEVARELAREPSLILLCGHYEGVDQRALDACIDEEISIGDYILTGGELAAPPWCSRIAWPASFPACWAVQKARRRNPSRTGCWNIPSIPVPATWTAAACRKSFCPVTMQKSVPGAAGKAWPLPPASVPIFSLPRSWMIRT